MADKLFAIPLEEKACSRTLRVSRLNAFILTIDCNMFGTVKQKKATIKTTDTNMSQCQYHSDDDDDDDDDDDNDDDDDDMGYNPSHIPLPRLIHSFQAS